MTKINNTGWASARKSLKITGVVTVVLFALLFVIGSFIPDEKPDATATKTPSVTKAPAAPKATASPTKVSAKPEPTPAKTTAPKASPKQALANAVTEINSKAKIKFANGDVAITFPIADNLTDGMIATGAQSETIEYLRVVKNAEYNSGAVMIDGTFSMQDQYGKVSNEKILRIGYTRETLDKIYLSNIVPDDIWELADLYHVVHTVLQD